MRTTLRGVHEAMRRERYSGAVLTTAGAGITVRVVRAGGWGILFPERFSDDAPPLLVVLSGPSGVGKDTVFDCLKLCRGMPWHFAVSHTTRPMRDGEQEGVEYYFIDTDTYHRMNDAGEFIETAKVHGNLYGLAHSEVRDALADGKDVFVILDYQGAAAIRQLAPDTLFVFLLPPSMTELRKRLEGRGSETPESLERRLKAAEYEISQRVYYDYKVINWRGSPWNAASAIENIVNVEKARIEPRKVVL